MQFTLEDIKYTFRDEIAPFARRVDNTEIRLNNIDSYIKDFSNKGLAEHKVIVDLNQRVDNIETSCSRTTPASNCSNDLLKEFDDRLRRRSNLMVYGLSEDDSSSSVEGNLQNKVNDCFSQTLGKPAPKIKLKFKCMRMGKHITASTNPRPVKIVFNDSDTADNILQAFIQCKVQKKLPVSLQHLAIARDQTPAQREEYLQLKEELRRRSQAGEKNLCIVARGTRQIIIRRIPTSARNPSKDQ